MNHFIDFMKKNIKKGNFTLVKKSEDDYNN